MMDRLPARGIVVWAGIVGLVLWVLTAVIAHDAFRVPHPYDFDEGQLFLLLLMRRVGGWLVVLSAIGVVVRLAIAWAAQDAVEAGRPGLRDPRELRDLGRDATRD